MAIENPKRLLDIAKANLAAGEQPVPDGNGRGLRPESIDRILALSSGLTGVSKTVRSDIGTLQAFGAGIKTGIKQPFRFLGVEPDTGLDLDETSEKAANFLGNMVGLGISFIPFAAGTGVVLKGIGLTARLTSVGVKGEQVISPTYFFLRNTIAGSAQFAGEAETREELGKNILLGASFGAAIEGFFLARAMRGRKPNPSQVFDTGSPISEVPVDPETLAKEGALAPFDGKTAERMAQEVSDLGTEGLSYDQILARLTVEHVEAVRVGGLEDTKSLIEYIKREIPDAAIYERSFQGGLRELLIHNPLDPIDALSPKQVAQWKAGGFPERMEVLYGGKSYEATGFPAAEGRVQIRDPFKPTTVFAPRIEEVTRPITPRFFSESLLKRQRLSAALADSETNVGFVIPAARNAVGQPLRAKRGVIDTSEYETVGSVKDFINRHRAELVEIQAESQEEALAILAGRRGIKGLVEKDEGIVTRILPFDQGTVSYVREVPQVAAGTRTVTRPSRLITPEIEAQHAEIDRLAREATGGRVRAPALPTEQIEVPVVGLTLDNAVVSSTLEGQSVIHSLVPSWKNSVTASLRKQGIPEKEISQYLDLHAAQMERRMDSLFLDDEFLAIKKLHEAQYTGGCI